MADNFYKEFNDDIKAWLKLKLLDLGDGTYAQAVTLMGTTATINVDDVTISITDAIINSGTITKVQSVVTVTEVSNITSVDVLDTVSKVASVVTVTEVNNVTSVDVVDTVSTIASVITVTSLSGGSINVVNSITTMSHTTAAITTASAQALTTNSARKYALLINETDTDMYLSFTAAAITSSGIYLSANGGNYEMSQVMGNLYTGRINAIHNGSAAKTILVTEGT